MPVDFANLSRVLCSLAALALVVVPCRAQSRRNVTVQLPTFHQFSVATSVVVPDRGSVYLGGVGYSSRRQSQAGLPSSLLRNRSLGRRSSAVGMSMSATIIDHNAIDRALLAEAARRRGALFDIEGRPVAAAPSGSPTVRSSRLSGRGIGGNSWRIRAASARDGRDSLAPPHFRRPQE